jgi:hypothetical protein
MSRRDLLTRGVGAGPDLPTPGAQCLGTDLVAFALLAGADIAGSDVPTAALQWRRPPLLLRGHAAAWAAPVDLGCAAALCSSVRRDDQGRLEIRVWNATGQAQPLALDAAQWEPLFADGRPDPRALSGGAADGGALVLRPHGVLTLRQRSPAGT